LLKLRKTTEAIIELRGMMRNWPSKVWFNGVGNILFTAVHLNFTDLDFDIWIRLQNTNVHSKHDTVTKSGWYTNYGLIMRESL